ncbi:hypothetical protein KKA13_01545 [Patescibacteria group bacterium]|nr:hypothetical protein [Patescibacteria group bacterium]MBU1613429.1 hypothetical protein [Patescibacteria group bacterium]
MMNAKDLSKTERNAVMKTQMESLKKWAVDNNIPEQYVLFHGGFGRGLFGAKGFGGQGQAKTN